MHVHIVSPSENGLRYIGLLPLPANAFKVITLTSRFLVLPSTCLLSSLNTFWYISAASLRVEAGKAIFSVIQANQRGDAVTGRP